MQTHSVHRNQKLQEQIFPVECDWLAQQCAMPFVVHPVQTSWVYEPQVSVEGQGVGWCVQITDHRATTQRMRKVQTGCKRIGRAPTRRRQPRQATRERVQARERLRPPHDHQSVAVFEGDRNGARLLVHQYLGHRSNTLINGRVASPTLATMTASRSERIETRARNPKWKNVPLRIEMAECINCDACLRHCPPQLGAIFNHGADVVIIPELCSGCDKCLPACPVNCIYPFPEWEAEGVPTEWWEEPGSENDPY